MDKADILAIPKEYYKIHADPFILCQDFIDSLYIRAQAYFSGKQGKSVNDVSEIPENDLLDFFRQFELVSHIFMFKGLEALREADPRLAGRMFEDAIKVLPTSAKFPDVFFYLLYLKILYNWPTEQIRETVAELYRQDPEIQKTHYALWSRLGEWVNEQAQKQLQVALEEYKPS